MPLEPFLRAPMSASPVPQPTLWRPAWPSAIHSCCASWSAFWSCPVPSDYSAPGSLPPAACIMSEVLSLWPPGSPLGLVGEFRWLHPWSPALPTLTAPPRPTFGRVGCQGFLQPQFSPNGSAPSVEVWGRWGRGMCLWRGLALAELPPRVLGGCVTHTLSLRVSSHHNRIRFL